jgi:hypothetical protein
MKTKLIRRQDNIAIIEVYDDGQYSRVIVPSNTVADNGRVSPEVVDMGIPYGCPWEEMVTLTATPEAIANELRRRGIYTAEDMLSNQRVVLAVVQSIYGVDAQALIKAAVEYRGGKRNASE